MRVFGFPVRRQAYRKAAGRVSSINTFRGPGSVDYETLGTPTAYDAPIVYACVSRISRTISQLPRKVRAEWDNRELKVPDWVENPNSYQGGTDFIKCLVASMLLWGEAFIIPLRTGRAKTVGAAVINPQYVWHYTYGNRIVWSINGREYPGEMIHLRNDALPGKVRGFAAANTMVPLTETNRVAQKFVYNVVEQSGAYQLGISFPEEVDASVIEDVRQHILQRHAGPDNAYEPLVLQGGATITPINQSNADGAFIDLSDMTAKQIAQFWFGIDDTMLGFKSDQPQVYQNAPSVWHRYWTFACRHIAQEIERGLTMMLPRGSRFDFDEAEVLLGGPHDRAKLAKELSAVNKTMGLKIYTEDELRKVTGMYPLPEYEPLTGGTEPEDDDVAEPERSMLALEDAADEERNADDGQ